MLNELMWFLIAHMVALFIFVVPTFALMWVLNVFAKALIPATRT